MAVIELPRDDDLLFQPRRRNGLVPISSEQEGCAFLNASLSPGMGVTAVTMHFFLWNFLHVREKNEVKWCIRKHDQAESQRTFQEHSNCGI